MMNPIWTVLYGCELATYETTEQGLSEWVEVPLWMRELWQPAWTPFDAAYDWFTHPDRFPF